MPSKSFLPLPSLGCSMPLSRVPCTKEQGRRRPQHARERPSTYPPPCHAAHRASSRTQTASSSRAGGSSSTWTRATLRMARARSRARTTRRVGAKRRKRRWALSMLLALVGPVQVAAFGGPCAGCWALLAPGKDRGRGAKRWQACNAFAGRIVSTRVAPAL